MARTRRLARLNSCFWMASGSARRRTSQREYERSRQRARERREAQLTLLREHSRCEREGDGVGASAVELGTAACGDAAEFLDDEAHRVLLLGRDRVEVLGEDAVQGVDLVRRDVDLGATDGRRLGELVGVKVRLGVVDVDDCG